MTIISLYNQKKWFLDWTLMTFWIISLAILIFSFQQQYIEKIEPCTLCKWQRYLYFLIFSLSPIGLIERFNLAVRNSLNFIFFVGFCLATYHTLVQFEWITDHCTITQEIENMDDFMKMLEQPKLSCSMIGWKLFGFSASIYNGILSFFALIALNSKTIK